MLAGTAALTSERFRVRLGGLALVWLACGMRETAWLAALPIIVGLFSSRTTQTRWRRVAFISRFGQRYSRPPPRASWLLIDNDYEYSDRYLEP